MLYSFDHSLTTVDPSLTSVVKDFTIAKFIYSIVVMPNIIAAASFRFFDFYIFGTFC